MKFRIGTVDGSVHETMNVSEEELLEELRAVDGAVATGRLSDVRVHTIEELMKFMDGLFKYDTSTDTQYVTLVMAPGVERKFNVRHIIWWEYERDQ